MGKKISPFIMESVSCSVSVKDEDKYTENILKAETLEIFNNLKKVTIWTTGYSPYREYPFNLESFLSSIQSSKPSITYIIRAWRKGQWAKSSTKYTYSGMSWLNDIVTPSLQKS